MSVIKLKIEEIGSGGEIGKIVNYVLDTQTNSNVSNTSYKVDVSGVFDVLDIATSGSSGISMASDECSSDLDLVFDENDNLSSYAVADGQVEDEENPSEFIWGIVPEDGKYSVKLTFTESKDLRHLLVYGDSVVGQYPVEAIIDGSTTITNIDNMWSIDFGEPSDTHTVEFTKWSLPNYNACLTRIMVSIRYLELGREFVNNFNTLSQTTTTPATVQYGVVANSGKLDINDINDELRGYIEEGIIENSNMKIELYINDNKVQTHTTSDSSYVEEERILRLQLTNGFSKWDNLTYIGRPLTSAMYADELLIEVLKTLEYNDEQIEKSLSSTVVYGNEGFTASVKEYLHTIYIPYPYLKSASYRETIDKFCNLAQLNVYADEDDLPIFVNARPVASIKEIPNAIKILPHNQISNVSKTIVLKNKYDGINTMATQVKDITDVETLVYNYKIEDVENLPIENRFEETETSIPFVDTLLGSVNAAIRARYVTGTAIIPEKTNENLTQIIKIDYGKNSLVGKEIIEKGPILNGEVTENDWVGTLSNYGELKYTYNITGGTQTIKLQDRTNISVEKDTSSGNYIVNYTVLVYLATSYSVSRDASKREAKVYKARDLELSFYGDKRVISFEDIDASSSNVTTARTVANLDNNELRQTRTLIGYTPIVDNIKNNILLDYKKGVQSGTVDLFAGTFKNSNGERVVSFKEGQLIKPYDIVYFEGDMKLDGSQRYWRVTGNNFKYESEPTNPLEIQEIAKVYDIPKFTVTFPTYPLEVYLDGKSISSGLQVDAGTKLKVKFDAIELVWIKVNGEEISDNSYITITSDTVITCKYKDVVDITDAVIYPSGSTALNMWYFKNLTSWEADDEIYTEFDKFQVYIKDSSSPYGGFALSNSSTSLKFNGDAIVTDDMFAVYNGEIYDDDFATLSFNTSYFKIQNLGKVSSSIYNYFGGKTVNVHYQVLRTYVE